MSDWLKDCEICNAGLCVAMDKYIEVGETERSAAKILSREATKKIGEELYTPEIIRNRYRYYKGKKVVGQNDPPKKPRKKTVLKTATGKYKRKSEKERFDAELVEIQQTIKTMGRRIGRFSIDIIKLVYRLDVLQIETIPGIDGWMFKKNLEKLFTSIQIIAPHLDIDIEQILNELYGEEPKEQDLKVIN